MKLPIVTAEKLWHWGSLVKERKFERGVSYEGGLFSMSACPDAWRSIGRFGGCDLHVSTTQARMLDLHAILDAKRGAGRLIRDHATSWAMDNKLIEKKELFYYSYFDDELDREMSYTYATREAMLEDHDEEDGEMTSSVEHVGTAELLRRHGFKPGQIIGLEFAIIEWAKANTVGLHGVYWDDLLDQMGLSAPRAGIFDHHLLNLEAAQHIPDDEQGLSALVQSWQEVTLSGHQDALIDMGSSR